MTFERTAEGAPRTWGALLDQGKWWRTSGGGWVRIVDMEPRHRLNTARWLLRRASTLADGIGFEELRLFRDAPDDVADGFLAEDEARMADPQRWLTGTVLYRALVEGLRPDAGLNDALADQARRDADLLGLDKLIRERMVEAVEQVPAATPGPARDARGRFMRSGRPVDLSQMNPVVDQVSGVNALREVLAAVDGGEMVARENHDALGHRGESDPCWETFHVTDIRNMVADAARASGLVDLAAEIENRIRNGWPK